VRRLKRVSRSVYHSHVPRKTHNRSQSRFNSLRVKLHSARTGRLLFSQLSAAVVHHKANDRAIWHVPLAEDVRLPCFDPALWLESATFKSMSPRWASLESISTGTATSTYSEPHNSSPSQQNIHRVQKYPLISRKSQYIWQLLTSFWNSFTAHSQLKICYSRPNEMSQISTSEWIIPNLTRFLVLWLVFGKTCYDALSIICWVTVVLVRPTYKLSNKPTKPR